MGTKVSSVLKYKGYDVATVVLHQSVASVCVASRPDA
jgi:hypothetical protein